MRILLLNHFVAPDPSPTAQLLGDLAAHWRARGWTVQEVGAGEDYHQNRRNRYARDVLAHIQLFWRGFWAGKAEVILCLTDPPCLPVTASVLAWCKRAKLVHWAMDIYPETALALGELQPGALARTLRWLMQAALHRCALLVALDEDMARRFHGLASRCEILPPWPPEVKSSSLPARDPAPWHWLYSGNLGRAHEYETLLLAQAVLEKRNLSIDLIFQGGGAGYRTAQAQAQKLNLQHCHFRDYVAREEFADSLLAADVLIATQKTATQGLLWPSKLALAALTARPIVWLGPTEGAVAHRLRQRAQAAGVFSVGDEAALADWVAARFHDGKTDVTPEECQELRKEVQRVRQQGLAAWTNWMETL